MKKQSPQMVAYSAWESKRTVIYTELKEKYAAIKEQENSLGQLTSCKKNRKERLVDRKLKGTITKAENAELVYEQRCENIEKMHQGNMAMIHRSKEKAISTAKETYDRILAKAEADYAKALSKADSEFDRLFDHYNMQNETSINKANTEYDEKKKMLEGRKETLEDAKNDASKTAAELAIEKQKRAILKEMKEVIDGIHMARSQIPEKERDFVFEVPELPEQIVDAHTPTPVTPAPKPKKVISEEQWMAYGEDASLAQMREQARMEKSVRPEYDIRPNPTPYGVIGTPKDPSKLYTKPNYVPDDEEPPVVENNDDEYDEEYIAERKAEFRALWSVPV